MKALQDRKTRRWLYSISAAVILLLGIYGVLDGQQIAGWMSLAAAVLGLAAYKTPDQEEGEPQ